MNLKFPLYFFLILTSVSCSKGISLEQELSCNTSLGETIKRADFNKNFEIEIPSHWKKSGYFDDLQSSVMAADTIKELTDSYILDIAYKYGEITIDESFSAKANSDSDYTISQSNIELFKELPSYWQVAKGTKGNYPYHLFQLFMETSKTGYLEVKAEFYGADTIDDRLCEMLAIINTIELNN